MIERPEVKVMLMYPDVIMPKYESKGAAAIDLRCYIGLECRDKPITLLSYHLMPEGLNNRRLINTGIKLAIPKDWCGIARFEKSSLGCKMNVHNVGGLFDSDYRGEVLLTLWNTGSEPVTIEHNQKIAQMVFLPCPQAVLTEVAELDDTERGEGGFGFTGKF